MDRRAAEKKFWKQSVEFEEPTQVAFSSKREGVDVAIFETLNASMATALEKGEPTSLEELLGISGIERSSVSDTETLGTGIDSLDESLDGGLRSGTLTEVASSAPSCGGQTLLLHLLDGMRRAQRFAALVDGSDCFDPQTAPPSVLEHLLWARCKSAAESMAVADALLRDENLGMVIVDLRWCESRELRRVKSGDWYRLQRLAERSSAHVCVFTPKLLIPSAQIRIELTGSLSLETSQESLKDRGSQISFEVKRFRKRERQAFPNLVQRSAAG